jgi:spermidine/putrescine transport system permease protein
MRARSSEVLLRLYIGLFFAYLFLPLAIMMAATFNASRFPTVTPWTGTTLQWFAALWADDQMWRGLWSSIGIGIAVILLALPIGTAGALLLEGLRARARTFLYALMVSPLLTPGVIIGISTLVFWNRLGVPAGLPLIVIGQTSFIAAYVMLLVLARLQRFDRTLEEAALDLGASHAQVFRRILLPHLVPALGAAAVLAFFQSFENFNTTIFLRGIDNTLTVYIASKVRTGLTPAVNALGLILILLTVLGAMAYEIMRRREARRLALAQQRAAEAEQAE